MHALPDRVGEAMVVEAVTEAIWEVQHQGDWEKGSVAEHPCLWAEAVRRLGELVLEDEVSPSVSHS